MNDFYMDKSDLRKFERFFKESPKLLRPVSANVLTSLAFDARDKYIKQIDREMTVRNLAFVKSSMVVQKAKSVSLDKQIAIAGSVRRPRSTGWEEQQKGTVSKTKRTITTAGRGGSKRNVAIKSARLSKQRKFYKPQQFQGPNNKSRFNFMLRVVTSRKGNSFIISDDFKVGNNVYKPGLYSMLSGKIRKVQTFNTDKITHIPWMTTANQQLKFSSNIAKKYEEGIRHIIKRQMKK